MKNHTNDFPYEEFEKLELWDLIDKSIEDLVKNQDIIENTPRNYIVGYLCKRVLEKYAGIGALTTIRS